MNSTQEFFGDNPWGAIDQPCYPEGRRLYLHDERFWVSMDDNRHLLFFVQDTGGDAVKPLENLAGLNVSIEQQANGDQRLVCRLTTAEPELEEKFSTVAKDIAFHCSGYKGAQLFLKTQERIKSWANFLKPSRSGLSHSEFVGLFGELYSLVEHLAPALTAKDAVRAWIGPEGKKQDFTLNNWALEVKTTVSGDQQTIRISSLDQLDRVTDKLYLLRVVAAPATDGNGLSLGELYERCRTSVQHDAVVEGMFLQKASALYGKASESQINEQFRIVNVSVFDVADEFPRLTRSDVHLAIPEARYEISIAALAPFEVESDVSEILNHG
jgi:hypothetical protein